jgi:peptide/nickel transport system permease protein
MTLVTEKSLTPEKEKSIELAEKIYKSPNHWLLIVKRLRKNKVAMFALYYILFNILIAIIYPIIIPYNPRRTQPGLDRAFGGGVRAFPNLKYPFGTSQIGHDSFSRILTGTETSILVGIFATLIAISVGVIVGLFAGYYKGKVEEVLMRITDIFLAVPFLIIALIIIRIGNSPQNTILSDLDHVTIIALLIGSFGWAGLARLVTANVKQVSTLEYVAAVKILGARDSRILLLHVLPNVLAPIIVVAALFIATAILSEAGLAFLGFADPSNTVSWGVEVSLNQVILRLHPELTLIPGLAIFFLVLAVNIFGDALRDALDPRLKD